MVSSRQLRNREKKREHEKAQRIMQEFLTPPGKEGKVEQYEVEMQLLTSPDKAYLEIRTTTPLLEELCQLVSKQGTDLTKMINEMLCDQILQMRITDEDY